MADRLTLPPPADMPSPNWSTRDAQKHWAMAYDKVVDTLYLHPGKPQAGIAIISEDGVWISIHPTTGEIVGMHIEDFQKVFLARHPEFAQAWKQMKSKRIPQSQKETWLEVLVRFIQNLMGENSPAQEPRLSAS